MIASLEAIGHSITQNDAGLTLNPFRRLCWPKEKHGTTKLISLLYLYLQKAFINFR